MPGPPWPYRRKFKSVNRRNLIEDFNMVASDETTDNETDNETNNEEEKRVTADIRKRSVEWRFYKKLVICDDSRYGYESNLNDDCKEEEKHRYYKEREQKFRDENRRILRDIEHRKIMEQDRKDFEIFRMEEICRMEEEELEKFKNDNRTAYRNMQYRKMLEEEMNY